MKTAGAIAIALLGLGIFPFNTRALLTMPGLMFAAMSIACLVIAYRLATSKKKTEAEC